MGGPGVAGNGEEEHDSSGWFSSGYRGVNSSCATCRASAGSTNSLSSPNHTTLSSSLMYKPTLTAFVDEHNAC
jgi:hypothetical protein